MCETNVERVRISETTVGEGGTKTLSVDPQLNNDVVTIHQKTQSSDNLYISLESVSFSRDEWEAIGRRMGWLK